MDRTENTSPNSSSIVASHSYHTDRVGNTASQLIHNCILRIYCLATGVFAEPFTSNCCLCWLHSSFLEKICHRARRHACRCLVSARYIASARTALKTFFYCCVHIRCHGNVFTQLLPRKGHVVMSLHGRMTGYSNPRPPK
jgi:hypothetical protein